MIELEFEFIEIYIDFIRSNWLLRFKICLGYKMYKENYFKM